MQKITVRERFIRIKRALFDKVWSQKLNPEQCRAVFTVKGPLLVLAGAGSGKTTVLVNRISYLLKYGNAYFSEEMPEGMCDADVEALETLLESSPEEIADILPEFISEPCHASSVLAITFTNKAANEIRARLSADDEDGTLVRSIWAGTFHSMCMRILRTYAAEAGLSPGFSIYDTDDTRRLLGMCMEELGIDEKRLSPKAVAAAISRAKEKLISPAEFTLPGDPREGDIGRVYTLYAQKLQESNAVDFDDIIMRTVGLLRTCADARAYYQRKFRYVMVDEYQDTNYAQFVLTKLLSDGYRNIMVVGDDDQSIYRFRGATIENILNFDKTYPDAAVVKLERNYRSTRNILDAANSVIRRNSARHEKTMCCDKPAGEKITVRVAEGDMEEARYILDKIVRAVGAGGRRYSDFAILYRVNSLARTLETAFVKSGVPYKVIGSQRFYDRKEVRDMLAYLSMLGNTVDNLRLKRIINEPKRKIGAATVETVERLAAEEGCSMYSVLLRAEDYPALAKTREKLSGFCRMIEEVRAAAEPPSAALRHLYEASGYQAMLLAEGFEGQGRAESVEELINAARQYEEDCAAQEREVTVAGFLEEVALVADVDSYDRSADAVVLMTVHAAKGLEFPVVFLAGMEDGIFPSDANRNDPAEMEEERRLCYVAITRAKEKLYITASSCRTMYGKTNTSVRLSTFIREEMDRSLLEEEVPRGTPPRRYVPQNAGYYVAGTPPRPASPWGSASRTDEVRRPPDIFSGSVARTCGAGNWGIEKYPPGTRVSHATFGAGTVQSARDVGGDVLYDVLFDSGERKKLMATFARLQKLG